MLQRAADWPYGFLTFHEHDLRLMRGWHRTGSERVDENRRACQHLYDILRERKPVSPAMAVRECGYESGTRRSACRLVLPTGSYFVSYLFARAARMLGS